MNLHILASPCLVNDVMFQSHLRYQIRHSPLPCESTEAGFYGVADVGLFLTSRVF